MESDDGEEVAILDYDVTDEPLEHPWFKRLPPPVQEHLNCLHDCVLTDPHRVIREGHEILEKYPDVPMVYSFLSSAYAEIGDHDNRVATVKTCRDKFPDYLFGKIALAQVYLATGKGKKIPEIFEGKLDLQLLYPQRTSFHLSEYMSFTSVLILYYDDIGRHRLAKHYYRMLTELVAPAHPLLRQLRRALLVSLLSRCVQWFPRMLLGMLAPRKHGYEKRQHHQHAHRYTSSRDIR
jgi:hypothetical protein